MKTTIKGLVVVLLAAAGGCAGSSSAPRTGPTGTTPGAGTTTTDHGVPPMTGRGVDTGTGRGTGVAPTTTIRRGRRSGSTYTSTAPSDTHVIATTTCSGSDAPAAGASGLIDTRRARPVRIASSACFLTISREHAPPMKPSMRPSAITIARSPR